jgi:hypothetical protein
VEGLGRTCLQITRRTLSFRVRPFRPFPSQSCRSFTRFSGPEIHLSLRFALDLVEVYFQVVHTRLPFLNPTHFRARLNVNVPQYASYANKTSASGASAEETLHPALMATVVAWGAKFSEHPLLVADRLNSPTRQSGLAKTLVNRAREVAEALKVHRVPAAEHVVIALLIEPLQSRALSSVLLL